MKFSPQRLISFQQAVEQSRREPAHGKADIFAFGQESNPTTWRLAHVMLAIQAIDANLGPAPGDTFLRDAHPDLKADFVRRIFDDE